MPELEIEHLTKRFGPQLALDDVSFTVADGELFTLLGPSGCGKTTTLLSVAGFVRPEAGAVRCGEVVFLDRRADVEMAAERRNLGIVFQSYAVWPHMTVAQNVAFPLRVRKAGKLERADRVAKALELVELGDLGDRYPHQLSGGQRQRVALARALIYQPAVLLLDEPFSNLDAKLRERARSWLKRLQQQLGVTTVFVTHDQDEAMAMSDRILVMDQGRIQQIGTPEAVYQHPANRFVAAFVGQCNFVDGVVATSAPAGTVEVALGHAGLRLTAASSSEARKPGDAVSVGIRPEALQLVDERRHNGHGKAVSGENVFDASITKVTFLGDHYAYTLKLGEIELVAHGPHTVASSQTKVAVDPRACLIV
jgi:iron(III) transport system ATP-binding protein